jgi:hypothetical protein
MVTTPAQHQNGFSVYWGANGGASMGHNDNDRLEARRHLGQAMHQQVAAIKILERKARTDDLNVRDGRVAFDPLDTASGRLALAVGDLILAVELLTGGARHDHRGPELAATHPDLTGAHLTLAEAGAYYQHRQEGRGEDEALALVLAAR